MTNNNNKIIKGGCGRSAEATESAAYAVGICIVVGIIMIAIMAIV